MPYVADRKVEDLINPAAVPRAGRRMTLKGGRRLHDETRRLTPVHTPQSGDLPRARKPGTLKVSIKRGVIMDHTGVGTTGWQVRVHTDDPVAPYVEWSTRPHEIRPKQNRPNASLHFAVGNPRRQVFAKVVQHPGTRGVHMFARAATKVQVQVPRIFAPELHAFKKDLTARRPGR